MVAPIELPVLLTQLPKLQQFQQSAQGHSEVFQSMAAQQSVEQLKKSQNQVPKTEKTETKVNVNPDQRNNQDHQAGNFSSRGKDDEEGHGPEQDRNDPGQIIDLNV